MSRTMRTRGVFLGTRTMAGALRQETENTPNTVGGLRFFNGLAGTTTCCFYELILTRRTKQGHDVIMPMTDMRAGQTQASALRKPRSYQSQNVAFDLCAIR